MISRLTAENLKRGLHGDRAGTGHAQREDLHGYSTDAVQVVPARFAHHGRLFRLHGLEDS